jgi:SAM-dependent methyltransferase
MKEEQMNAPETSRPGDARAWEQHWHDYDAAAQRNPAQRYRRELIFSLLENAQEEPLRILDLGCGQGDFLAEAGRRLPGAQLAGVDLSSTGLTRTQLRVPLARLHQADFESEEPLPAELRGFATHVVCTEVLEHLDSPRILLRKVSPALAPGGKLLITVPGGPRSAFDIHIGHRRHYGPRDLEALVCGAGYEAVEVKGAGFPFFNLYKLMVILRGKKLVEEAVHSKLPQRASMAAMRAFDTLFRLNHDGTGLGWQTFGVFQSRSITR